MNSFEIITIAVVAILAAIVGVKYLIRYNVKVDDLVKNVEHGIDIVQIVLDAIPIPDGNKIGISKVLDLVSETCDLVDKYYDVYFKQDGTKLKVATDKAFELLDELDIQVTIEERRLISIVLSESLKFLEK